MRSILKRWASSVNFATGPKIGELTKSEPNTIATEGTQPGSGSKVTAEEFNHLMNLMGDLNKDFVAARLTNWTLSDIEAGYTTWRFAAGRNYASGHVFTAVEAIGGVYKPISLDQDGGVSNPVSLGDTTVSNAVFAPSAETRNSGPGLYFGYGDTGPVYKFAATETTNPASFVVITGSITLTAANNTVCAAYDETNGAVVITASSSSTTSFYRIADAASPAIATATTTTATAEAQLNSLAAGGGVAMTVGIDGVDYICSISSDGGDTWATATAPTDEANSDDADVRYLTYMSDFLNEGPAFVLLTLGATDEVYRLHYSRDDGTSWTVHTSIDWSEDFIVGQSDALILGDYVFHLSDRSGAGQILYAHDYVRGKSVAVPHFLEAGTVLSTDGHMLFSGGAFASSSVYFSGDFVAPKAIDYTELDA